MTVDALIVILSLPLLVKNNSVYKMAQLQLLIWISQCSKNSLEVIIYWNKFSRRCTIQFSAQKNDKNYLSKK